MDYDNREDIGWSLVVNKDEFDDYSDRFCKCFIE